jgi:hypothetical protein
VSDYITWVKCLLKWENRIIEQNKKLFTISPYTLSRNRTHDPAADSNTASQCPFLLDSFIKPRLDQQVGLFVIEYDSRLYSWELVLLGCLG